MDAAYNEKLRHGLLLLTNFNAASFVLTDLFWKASGREEPGESGLVLNIQHLESTRKMYYEIEKLKSELEAAVLDLRQGIMVEQGADEFGNIIKMKDRERESWVNWLAFTSRSLFQGLQGLYGQFLSRHQDEMFKRDIHIVSRRATAHHELLRKYQEKLEGPAKTVENPFVARLGL